MTCWFMITVPSEIEPQPTLETLSYSKTNWRKNNDNRYKERNVRKKKEKKVFFFFCKLYLQVVKDTVSS